MTLYKSLALAGGTATAVGGGVLASKSSLFQSTPVPKATIKDRLKKAGYSVDFDNSKWNKIHDEYKKTSTNTKIKFSSETIDVEALKAKCFNYLQGEAEDAKYEIAKRWCVEPKKISEFLTGLQLTAINTADESAKTSWEKLETEYRKDQKEKIPNFTLQEAKDADTWKTLKEQCKKLLDLSPWDNDYESSMKSTQLWCVTSVVPA
ncbi:hypothetical protein HF1_08590 [Mycoplasma haemofelis str. Langford 1]|uniref:Uncharacterized protein n=2 Tax=Mycoplasma haemofelis TaxID=29501 RepID=F6FIZ7_MYCHI|nr:hypothetical protein [Mycoplasma haemofelis]AEG73195.1 hypothetical protein MHF_0938 [Mycoplasma haemofelis Ohio2]CBY92867.1 hypothetical protein HF1_08590 [Mycoplasma haemofelis str. Langford 1]